MDGANETVSGIRPQLEARRDRHGLAVDEKTREIGCWNVWAQEPTKARLGQQEEDREEGIEAT
jgi:hypothetical protein